MLELYAHPFSSYCWKVLIALYERGISFEYRMLDGEHPEHFARLKEVWPVGKFPVVFVDGAPVIESSIIIETLDEDRFSSGPKLIPADRHTAREVRFMDRVFDNHVMNRMQVTVDEYIHYRDNMNIDRLERTTAALDTVYDWLEARLSADGWACGEAFTLADCAAAPSLFYADWVHEIGARRPHLKAYRARLLARPSVSRCVEDARPYRSYFPPGAPDRD
ncbi:MAG: glutathione S-transferase family protein [Sphingobium sp.]|nr:glutathione S-transferase family protein [Sphingobium sp.]MCI1272437.1 glutathione S-transferase family protein [Sphingobium sp.]MCI1756526.1 glutathione S-transferase family protein [Sphingobium sp.]